jgi:hypothetical protein
VVFAQEKIGITPIGFCTPLLVFQVLWRERNKRVVGRKSLLLTLWRTCGFKLYTSSILTSKKQLNFTDYGFSMRFIWCTVNDLLASFFCLQVGGNPLVPASIDLLLFELLVILFQCCCRLVCGRGTRGTGQYCNIPQQLQLMLVNMVYLYSFFMRHLDQSGCQFNYLSMLLACKFSSCVDLWCRCCLQLPILIIHQQALLQNLFIHL